MTPLIFYVLESSFLLAILYLLYALLLSKETYFQLNRVVLLLIPLISFLLPLLRVDFGDLNEPAISKPLEELGSITKSYYELVLTWEARDTAMAASEKSVWNTANWFDLVWPVLSIVYVVGFLFCFARTITSLQRVLTLTKKPALVMGGVKIVRLDHPLAPFSFLDYVFVHAPLVEAREFTQILQHERVHIEEKHTIDLLYLQVIAALLWFNPVIWQLLKSLKTTHEYIADRKIIQSGYSVDEYQILLLEQLISSNSQELVHNFNLSFMKKRIAMMTSGKSGWAGRVRAGAAALAMLCLSVVLIQCNSKLEDSGFPSADVTFRQEGVTLPTVPPSGFKFDGDLSSTLVFSITGDKLFIGEKAADITEISRIEDPLFGRKLPILMKVDENQNMGFVRKVHDALRSADRRKLIYAAQTAEDEPVQIQLILPPPRESKHAPNISDVPEERILKIDLGANVGPDNQRKVYEYVMPHVKNGTAELPVISAKFKDSDNFGAFLRNLFFVKEGYIQIYQERSQEMFGKDFYSTNEKEFKAVRENIPMNISIAED